MRFSFGERRSITLHFQESKPSGGENVKCGVLLALEYTSIIVSFANRQAPTSALIWRLFWVPFSTLSSSVLPPVCPFSYNWSRSSIPFNHFQQPRRYCPVIKHGVPMRQLGLSRRQRTDVILQLAPRGCCTRVKEADRDHVTAPPISWIRLGHGLSLQSVVQPSGWLHLTGGVNELWSIQVPFSWPTVVENYLKHVFWL